MKSYALEKLDIVIQSHTVGLHLEPGPSGPQLVFSLVLLSFCVQS